MDETGKIESGNIIRVGDKMNSLVEKIQEKFNEKYGFKPKSSDVTNMIADAISKRGIHIL